VEEHGGGDHLRRKRRLVGPRGAAQGRPLGAGHARAGAGDLALRPQGHVDHTVYDTASILRLITRTFGLEKLDGLKQRDDAMIARGQQPMGDLTNALQFKA
jgi:phospholipase C